MGAAQLRLNAKSGFGRHDRPIPHTANDARRDVLDYLIETGRVAPTQAAAVRALARRSGATEHHILIHCCIVSEQGGQRRSQGGTPYTGRFGPAHLIQD